MARPRSSPIPIIPHSRLAVLTMLALLLMVGCPRHFPRPEGGPEGPGVVLSAIDGWTRTVRSVRGFARMEVFGPEGRARVEHLILAERPARVRVETLTPFDQPLAYLASDGTDFALYSLENKTFYVGKATARNLARLLPIRLEPRALVDVLLGGVPLVSREVAGGLSWDETRGSYVLWFRDPAGGLDQLVRVHPETLLPVDTRVSDASGREVWSLELSDREETDGAGAFPRSLRFRMPGEGIDLRLRWMEVEVNVDIPADAWTLERPRGVPVEELDP